MRYGLSVQKFENFNLSAPVLKAIAEMGYETPSPIQEQAIPMLLESPTDFMGLAGTGTGKTAAFGIPLVERIDTAKKGVQVLILCPTRELAVQVAGQISLLGKHKGVTAAAVYGGASFGDQVKALKKNPAIIVGTPGRVIDHLEKGTINLSQMDLLVLDEADEMISMGFKDELEMILEKAPLDTANIWLFSATMSREVRHVADHYLRSPKQVQVNKKEMLSENVSQIYYLTQESHKAEILCKVYGLIFCQTKSTVSELNDYLRQQGYKVDSLHGDMDQRERDKTMKAFRDRKVKMLVCTDVAARGLDVKDVTHVINHSLPRELDSYVHRIGRTARSGKSGLAISLVTPQTRRLIAKIEFLTKSKMEQAKIPTGKEVAAKKVSSLLAKFEGQDQHARASVLLNDEWKAALADKTPEEIVGRFLSILLPEVTAKVEKENRAPGPIEIKSGSVDENQKFGIAAPRGTRWEEDERPRRPSFPRQERYGSAKKPGGFGVARRESSGETTGGSSGGGFAPKKSWKKGGGTGGKFKVAGGGGHGGFRKSDAR
jgi:ATP-dependent RNA helicase DeaD